MGCVLSTIYVIVPIAYYIRPMADYDSRITYNMLASVYYVIQMFHYRLLCILPMMHHVRIIFYQWYAI